MRFLSLGLLSLSCLLSPASLSVSAQCTAAASADPTITNPPNTNALTMFVTSTVYLGALVDEAGSGPSLDGLTAADALCTSRATASGTARANYNKGIDGLTVQFTALLSSSATPAINRITPGVNIQSFQNGGVGYKCLASNAADLFSGFNGKGYNLDNKVFTEAGVPLSANVYAWTSTGIPAAGTSGGTAAEATAAIYGGRYHTVGTPPADYATTSQQWFCNDWTQVVGTGSVGIFGATSPNNANTNTWLQAQTNNQVSCNLGFRLICLSAQPFTAPTLPPAVAGDPQFVGLQGQQFQVHGMPEEFFNLITTPTFQLNSRFTYLASGNCNYNNTECWTHPGTYVDQLGFMFPGLQLKAVAGPHHKGLRVWINEEEMVRSTGRMVMTTTSGVNSTETAQVIVSHTHHDTLLVSFPLFTFEVTNSDWFFNFNIQFHAPSVLAAGSELHFIRDARAPAVSDAKLHYMREGHNTAYPAYPMHGLVGQTWKNARYPAKRMYQGEVDDYMLLDHQLFSTQFMYNLYSF